MTAARPHIVIVGAGFGGLKTAQKLRHAHADVTLVDRYNYHTFQPLLYQVATSALTPEDIAHSARGIFHAQRNLRFFMGKVSKVDFAARQLRFTDGQRLAYDYLILAAGASTNDFGVPGVKEHAFYLKTLPQAVHLRSHVITQFECVDTDPSLAETGALTFVLVGGGPTGVEMAGALNELFKHVLTKDYPRVNMRSARVILIEMTDRLLSPFHPQSSAHARDVLERLGVEVRLGEAVVEVSADEVVLKSGERIAAQTLVWAAGVRGNPLADRLGLELTRGFRVKVNDDLSVPGYPEVFVIGDLAGSVDETGNLLPQVAPVANQGGQYVAELLLRRLHGRPDGPPFVYKDPGIMATIGRGAAVAELPSGRRLQGFLGWLAWLFVHILNLIGFRNRVSVMLSWMYNYFTYDRNARLIMDVVPEVPSYRRGEDFVKQTEKLKTEAATRG